MTTIAPWNYRMDASRMVAYAGATWDWHRLHHDVHYAQELGFAGPVVDGQHLGALVAAYVMRHAGPDWRMADMSFDLVGPVVAGESLRFEGRHGGDTSHRRYEVQVMRAEGDQPPVLRNVHVTCVSRRHGQT